MNSLRVMVKTLNSRLRLEAFLLVKKLVKKITGTRRDRIRRFHGLMKLYSHFHRSLKPKGILLTQAQGLKMYINATDDVIGPEILAYGCHEEYETELFKKALSPSMVIADIGANMGYYSLIAAKLVGGRGKVYAFEPDPTNYDLLVANIHANNFTNIIPIQRVVSNKAETVKLFLDRGNSGAHTLCESNIQTDRSGFVEVEAITLDAYFNGEGNSRVDFIKMDVQGAEGRVIEKAHEILKRNNLKILMEFWPQGLRNMGTDPAELLETLRGYDFSIRLLLHERIQEEENIAKVVEIGESEGYVNLFLEKRRSS